MSDLFSLCFVNTVGDIPKFTNWLTLCARQDTPISVALKKNKFALSTREDCFVVDLKAESAPLAMGVLRTHLLIQGQLQLLSRDLYSDLVDLSKLFAAHLGISTSEVFNTLSPLFVGDLTSAAHVINQSVTPKAKFRQIEHDAYEVALLEPQFAYGLENGYYYKVGIPFAKLQAETTLVKPGDVEWFVSYPETWVRVLAFWSGDPTLTWALIEGRSPMEAVGTLLKVDPEQAEYLLLWQACGRDMEVFTKRFPHLMDMLPEDLPQYGDAFDRSLPALSMACVQMKQAYYESRQVETRYGRRLRPGNPLGEAIAFRVFGTVEDLINVAAVSFWQNRPSTDILITQLVGGLDTIRVGGVGPKRGKEMWFEELKQLSNLANPLGQIDLKANVVER